MGGGGVQLEVKGKEGRKEQEKGECEQGGR